MLISLSADLNVFAFQHTTTTIDNKLLSSNEYIYLIQVLTLCGVFYTRSDHQTTHISSFIYHAIIEHIVLLYKRRILFFIEEFVISNATCDDFRRSFFYFVWVFSLSLFFSHWNENVLLLIVSAGIGNDSSFFVYPIMKMKRNQIDKTSRMRHAKPMIWKIRLTTLFIYLRVIRM